MSIATWVKFRLPEPSTTSAGCRVFDKYGSREFSGIAYECEAHEGLHVSTENILVEVLVTENGRQRAALPGEYRF